MVDRVLGMDSMTFNGLILLLLLVILGIVSFNYYAFINTNDGLRFGTGIGAGILSNRRGAEETELMRRQQQYMM